MQSTQFNINLNMLKHEVPETNSNMFLFVNPYEVNPGNSRLPVYVNEGSLTTQMPSILDKTHSGDLSTCEFQQTPCKRVKVEMEEFSNLGELIRPLRRQCVMDDSDQQEVEAEKIHEFILQSYESQSFEDLVDIQDSHKCVYHPLYIDNQHINLDDINEDDLHIQQELPSGCANSDLNVHSNNNSIKTTNMVNKRPSNIFQFEVNGTSSCCTDHSYSNVSSPSERTFSTEGSPIEFSNNCYDKNGQFRRKETEFNLQVKLFVDDTLNTPDILESVVSLEDERFNFLSCLNNEKLQTINESDLTFEPTLSSQVDEESLILTSAVSTKQSRKRKKYDSDEDYTPPPTRICTRKKIIKFIETETESDEEYLPTTDFKNSERRSRRMSSLSSDSSKDSRGVSKYRELRDKNNESSRKSRLKRRVKEHEIETEAQALENRNVKLKTEVEELQKVVDNFRTNLFQIMMKK